MPDEYHHEVDLLLECGHVVFETIEAAIFAPSPGELRSCPKCKAARLIKKVGRPYRVDHEVQNTNQKKK